MVKVINLKNVNKIFKTEFTKLRPEDLLRISEEKARFMNLKELTEFRKFANKVFSGDSKHFEFFAKREKGKVRFIPFD